MLNNIQNSTNEYIERYVNRYENGYENGYESGYESWYADLAPHMNPFNDNIDINTTVGTSNNRNVLKISKSIVKSNLYTRKFVNDTNTQSQSDTVCKICLFTIANGEIVSSTVCDHIFHKLCLLQWIDNEHFNGCPTCRNTMEQAHTLSKESIIVNDTNIIPHILNIVNSLKNYVIGILLGYITIALLSGLLAFISLLSKSIHIEFTPLDPNLLTAPIDVMKKLFPI